MVIKHMNVMIVEPNGSGHHMALYVRHVARKLVEAGIKVSLLTTQSAIANPSFNLVRADVGDNIDLYFMSELLKFNSYSTVMLLFSELNAWFALRKRFAKIAKELRPDIVYVPTLDWMAKATELFGSPFGNTPFVALYMSPKHHRKVMGLGLASRQDWLYHKLFQRLLKIETLQKILVIDEFFFEYCQKHYGELTQKVKYIPDFGELRGSGTKRDCRLALGIGIDKKVILVYGSLTKRKGIFELCEAFLSPNVPDDVILLLAGKADEEIDSIMKTNRIKKLVESGRIVTQLFFHPDDEEYRVFMSSDYVWIGYTSGFYASSGVLYQAASIGLPVISMQDGLIGRIVKKHSLGKLINVGNPNTIVEALCEAVLLEDRIAASSENKSFLRLHAPDCHSSSVLETLKSVTSKGENK